MKYFEKQWIFIAGTQRSGTTSFYNYISKDKKILMINPVKPEPKFLINLHSNLNNIKIWEKKSDEFNLICEKSTSYIEYPKVAQNIADNFTNYEIVFLLRDPVERAISNYYFSLTNHLESREIAEALFSLNNNKLFYNTSVNPFKYLERGMYYKYLDPYFNILNVNKITLVILEKFILDDEYKKYILLKIGVDLECLKHPFIKKNSSPHFPKIDSFTKKKLINYYKTPNNILKNKFGVDISFWH